MADNTTAAMDHLRESCAIAARSNPVRQPEQVTCWETDGFAPCPKCGTPRNILTDGRKEWVSCLTCEYVNIVGLAP